MLIKIACCLLTKSSSQHMQQAADSLRLGLLFVLQTSLSIAYQTRLALIVVKGKLIIVLGTD